VRQTAEQQRKWQGLDDKHARQVFEAKRATERRQAVQLSEAADAAARRAGIGKSGASTKYGDVRARLVAQAEAEGTTIVKKNIRRLVREEQTKQGQLTVSKKTKARLGEWQAEELRVGGGYECYDNFLDLECF
jgi:hypothetical protein